MRVLVTGSKGQLGSEIRDLYTNYENIEFIFKDLPELDISNINLLNPFIIDQNINAVINCAAYTAVDEAEENFEISENVNSKGVSNLVKVLKKVGAKLIHISTDYVFDGNNFLPYEETDLVNPVGIYAKTKRAGELAAVNSDIDSIVIRTSWLYSSYGNNFVKKMLQLGRSSEQLNVVFDQVGTPTYARDLAKACLDILCFGNSQMISQKGRLYHYSNEGVASWYDFAVSIMDEAGIGCDIKPILTTDFPNLAIRPHYSVLNKSKIKNHFKIQIPHWKDSLRDCLKKIKTGL